ncbi:MAG: benzoate/H(+) symporter BenE family transporter [Sulfuritalea sp.]|nr:benzoate/H(+) symporter BenE family transporter [Sulfuritalea sp.]
MQFFKDWSVSTFTAGFVAVLVGFTSSIAIVFQAALSFGATPDMLASWLWAIGIGMGLTTALPSLWLRQPVMVAWSTPGAAVLASAGLAGGFTMGDAVGAFMMSAALIVLIGVTGWFEKLMNRIPPALASALLAGALARFGLSGFSAAQTALPLVLLMLITYLLGKRFVPRYAVPLTLLFSVLFVAAQGGFTSAAIPLGLTVPVFVMPVFSFSALVSLALPLFIVTMASQNLPGLAAIRATGFGDERQQGGDAGIPVSKIITLTGLATLVLAPFGAFSLNLSAITAAMCMGPESHPDKSRRYTAAVSCGVLYVILGLFGATIMAVLTAFPKELVAAIAGLALMGTIAAALATALHKEADREAAMVTFLITLSGVIIGGVGSAFWGVVAGVVAMAVQHYHPQKRKAPL